jgi:hypothetical protein|tara:strand:+ start:167 stop:391 length:225 start_codon:yes stop_codon:yes gene_type:complete
VSIDNSEMMNAVEDIEKAIEQLPENKLQQFRAWYEKFDMDSWDKQIAKDSDAGKLDALAQAALADHKAGKSSEI